MLVAAIGSHPRIELPRFRATALVVDDSGDMRDLLRDVLDSDGWQVTLAGSGQRALRLMAVHRPDVVLIDLLMPGMSGFALRSTMLHDPALADIPVVILSAYWARPSETLEAAAVLGKPVNIDRLLEALDGIRRMATLGITQEPTSSQPPVAAS
jgi:CheY-like chemotaxis protein